MFIRLAICVEDRATVDCSLRIVIGTIPKHNWVKLNHMEMIVKISHIHCINQNGECNKECGKGENNHLTPCIVHIRLFVQYDL